MYLVCAKRRTSESLKKKKKGRATVICMLNERLINEAGVAFY